MMTDKSTMKNQKKVSFHTLSISKVFLCEKAPTEDYSEQLLESNDTNIQSSNDPDHKINTVIISASAPYVDISELQLNGTPANTLDSSCRNMPNIQKEKEYTNLNKGYQKLQNTSLIPDSIRKRFNKLVTLVESLPNIRILPDDERYLAIHDILGDLQNSFKIANEPPILFKPDLSGDSYDLYPGVRVVKPYIWLKEHWGKWLKHFNKELNQKLPYDFLYQDELNKLDPKLLKALKNQSYNIKKEYGFSTPEIIPPKKIRTDVIVQHCDQEKLREYYKTHNAMSNRER